MLERPLWLLSLVAGIAVLLCFPIAFLTWPRGTAQVVQSAISLAGVVLAGVYLLRFRKASEARRRPVWLVLVGTSLLLVLEVVGVVVTSIRMD